MESMKAALANQGRDGLVSSMREISGIEPSLVRSMFAIFERYYADVSLDRFQADLADKTSCLLLHNSRGELCGFTSLKLEQARIGGSTVRVIFSGDTIVERPYWGDLRLPFDWIANAGRIKREAPDIPLYWFLIVKGHRTYRYLPAFTLNFHPHPSGRFDPALKDVVDSLAQRRFGSAYDPASGVIRFESRSGRLHEPYADIDERAQRSPAVRFFLQRNPGYRQGDELACITELDASNMRPLAARVFRNGYVA